MASCRNTKADLVFVVDASGSIRDANPTDGSYDNWAIARNFLASLIDVLEISPDANRVGLVRFANFGESMWYLNSMREGETIKNAIMGLNHLGSNTNTSGGLRVMMQEQFQASRGDRPDVKNIAVILTDGASTIDNHRTISDAVAAREAGVEIFVIGVTDKINEEEIRLMSSPPQQMSMNYFMSPSFSELDRIRTMIIEETCAAAGEQLRAAVSGCERL